MTNSQTTTGRGRPAIGPRTYVRMEQEVMDELDAWAAERGMKRAEAIRHLVVTGMQIGDAASTLETLGRLSIESLFPEADGDEVYELLAEEAGCSEHRAEVIDTVAAVEVTVMAARGHWVLVVDRGPDGRTACVHETAAAAREAFAGAVVALTDELWTAGELWCDFAGDLDLFTDLARTGRIPAAAIGGLSDES